MYEEIAAHFGLTDSEHKVLSVIGDSGIVDTTSITKGTGISRPNCYDTLNRLINKGLITRIHQNRKTLYKLNRLDLSQILEEKEKEIALIGKEIELFNRPKEDETYYDVEVFSGTKSFRRFMLMMGPEISVFGAEGMFEKRYPSLFNTWIKNMQKIRAIYNIDFKPHRQKNHYDVIEARYTERDLSSRTTTMISKDSVSLIHWKEEPLVIHIRNRGIAGDYMHEFNRMWTKIDH